MAAAPFALYGVFMLLARAGITSEKMGIVVGLLALVGVVGGSYLLHWRIVRCPACERWLVPQGINGFAPRTCPHCKASLR